MKRLVILLVAACGGGDDDGDGARVDATAGAVDATGGADAGLPPADEVVGVSIDGCDGIEPGSEDCHFRLLWKPAACGGGACERLVVYWSGGEQSCAGGMYDPLIEKYADAGFVAACAQPFSTSEEAGVYPYAAELERMEHIIALVRATAGAAWDGGHLLHAGVSHGATAPATAIAAGRALKGERAAVWTGATHTAVVLFDGISNPATLEEWTATQDNCATWHRRFVGRYGDGTPLVHSCANDACYCSDPPSAAAWAQDVTDIASVAPDSPYSCEDFNADRGGDVLYRYVSCGGGAAAPCGSTGDIIPDEQQNQPYLALSECPGVTASYRDFPNCPHTLCGAWDACGGAEAVAWLEENDW